MLSTPRAGIPVPQSSDPYRLVTDLNNALQTIDSLTYPVAKPTFTMGDALPVGSTPTLTLVSGSPAAEPVYQLRLPAGDSINSITTIGRTIKVTTSGGQSFTSGNVLPQWAIGTVTTGAAGSSASASIGGTALDPTLSLTIPRGNTGPQGIPGVKGDPGDVAGSRKINAGTGLTGGGDLTADRTLKIADGVSTSTAIVVTTGTDLDTLQTPGYYIVKHSSTPSGNYGLLRVYPSGNNAIIQHFESDLAANRTIYNRLYRDGAWGSWTTVTGTPHIAARGCNSDRMIPSVASTQVNWDKVLNSDSGTVPFGGNQWTIPQSGVWRITAIAKFAYLDKTSWNLRQIRFFINGSQWDIYSEDRTAAAVCAISKVYRLTQNQTVRVEVAQHTGGNLALVGAESSVYLERVSD